MALPKKIISGKLILGADNTIYLERADNGGSDDLRLVIGGAVYWLSAAQKIPNVTKFWLGAVTVTAGGGEMIWYNDTGSDVDISRLQIEAGYQGGSSGNTVLTVNTDGVGGATDTLTVTLAYNASGASDTSGLTIPAGEAAYLFFTSVAGHENVTATLYLSLT